MTGKGPAGSAPEAGSAASAPHAAAEALVALVKRRVESRYRRILFVHQELAKLDAAAAKAKRNGPGAEFFAAGGQNAPRSFEDFVFSQIDFSLYKKIEAAEFLLLFDQGLEDFDEPFFTKAFKMDREKVRALIAGSYLRAGPFYVCKSAGPLLLSIMRTLHSSLEFAPLLSGDDLSSGEQLRAAAGALNGMVIRHGDGRETRLFTPDAADRAKTTTNAEAAETRRGPPLLCGAFYPLGKAYTITLI
ncbi:MAG: hypothetical protein LBG84_06060 [Treponema sp.]|jgi:hypothetical protein|nr:hypothetical protein [Treponema sp.]